MYTLVARQACRSCGLCDNEDGWAGRFLRRGTGIPHRHEHVGSVR